MENMITFQVIRKKSNLRIASFLSLILIVNIKLSAQNATLIRTLSDSSVNNCDKLDSLSRDTLLNIQTMDLASISIFFFIY